MQRFERISTQGNKIDFLYRYIETIKTSYALISSLLMDSRTIKMIDIQRETLFQLQCTCMSNWIVHHNLNEKQLTRNQEFQWTKGRLLSQKLDKCSSAAMEISKHIIYRLEGICLHCPVSSSLTHHSPETSTFAPAHSTASSSWQTIEEILSRWSKWSNFFKYYSTLLTVFEKIAAEIVICSILGADELIQICRQTSLKFIPQNYGHNVLV